MSVADPLIQASLIGEAIDGGPVGVLVADENMRYIAVNEFAARFLGYTRVELLALRVTDVAPSEATPEAYRSFLRTGTQEGVSPVRRKDGADAAISYHAAETRIAGMTVYISVFVPA